MSALKSEILNRLSAARLPSLPHVLLKLMTMCEQDNTTISDLAGLIEQEPAMTHKILQIVNSPAYRHMGQQNKLEQSLITLGTHLVRMLVINESVFQNFNHLPAFQHHNLHFYWMHSLKTAVIARKAAGHMGLSNIDEAYLAGLLHDIGRLALLTVVPDLYKDIFYLPNSTELCEKEREALDLDHTEAGAALIRLWEFGSDFAESVAHHHSLVPSQALPGKLSRLIRMSNLLAECEPEMSAVETIANDHQFPAAIAAQIIVEASHDVNNAATQLGLDINKKTPPQPAAPQQVSELIQQQNQKMSSLIQTSELGRFFQAHKTEVELQDAALKAASALFSLNSAILFWQDGDSSQYQIIAVNKTVEQLKGRALPSALFGWITDTFTRKLPAFVTDANDFTLTQEKNIARLLGGNSWILLPLADNSHCPGLIFASVSQKQLDVLHEDKYRLIYFGQQFVATLGNIHEITKKIEDNVALAEANHRRISQEMANEVSSPLSVIRNYLFVLNKQLDNGTHDKSVISILDEEVSRLGKLINEMNDPAYAQKARTERTDIKALVQNVITLFHETGFIPSSLQIITHVSSALPEKMFVRAPENLLKQVVVNLIKNGVQAMPSGGSLMITYQGLVEKVDEKYYVLSIRDTGPAIPEADLKKLFQPTETTTKEKDRQGLGLSTVYNLINEIGAQIGCKSDAGGTVFTLLIPAHTEKKANP